MTNIVAPIAKAMGTWSSQITIGSMFLRLFLSITLAAILGCERASKRHSAGVRTFLVISLASTIASMIDMFLIECFDFKYAFVSSACVIALVSISNNLCGNVVAQLVQQLLRHFQPFLFQSHQQFHLRWLE